MSPAALFHSSHLSQLDCSWDIVEFSAGAHHAPREPHSSFLLVPLGVASEILVMDPVFTVQRKTSAGMVRK